ncbi:hypothetical protein SS05631_b56960 (plasmid) [Sinorhizobium sp. CCBAU 05631]|nr:hypothetical protein SS05631_b56960 [Sinorhizobium sp. CCBAU 05631]
MGPFPFRQHLWQMRDLDPVLAVTYTIISLEKASVSRIRVDMRCV